jgi:hypothetical protein
MVVKWIILILAVSLLTLDAAAPIGDHTRKGSSSTLQLHPSLAVTEEASSLWRLVGAWQELNAEAALPINGMISHLREVISYRAEKLALHHLRFECFLGGVYRSQRLSLARSGCSKHQDASSRKIGAATLPSGPLRAGLAISFDLSEGGIEPVQAGFVPRRGGMRT